LDEFLHARRYCSAAASRCGGLRVPANEESAYPGFIRQLIDKNVSSLEVRTVWIWGIWRTFPAGEYGRCRALANCSREASRPTKSVLKFYCSPRFYASETTRARAPEPGTFKPQVIANSSGCRRNWIPRHALSAYRDLSVATRRAERLGSLVRRCPCIFKAGRAPKAAVQGTRLEAGSLIEKLVREWAMGCIASFSFKWNNGKVAACVEGVPGAAITGQ